jgi:hypothetical protein
MFRGAKPRLAWLSVFNAMTPITPRAAEPTTIL